MKRIKTLLAGAAMTLALLGPALATGPVCQTTLHQDSQEAAQAGFDVQKKPLTADQFKRTVAIYNSLPGDRLQPGEADHAYLAISSQGTGGVWVLVITKGDCVIGHFGPLSPEVIRAIFGQSV